MLQSGGWTLRWDEDMECFVIECPDRELQATFYLQKNLGKAHDYLKDMLNGTMPKHEVLIMDRLNGLVNRIEKLEQSLQQMNQRTKRMIS